MYCHYIGWESALYTEVSFIESVLYQRFHCVCNSLKVGVPYSMLVSHHKIYVETQYNFPRHTLVQAIFEVVTTEATYLRSLDVLIDHFMEDPGMNPNLPEGRRVLDKRQHHVIFSNVQEVREISARSVAASYYISIMK